MLIVGRVNGRGWTLARGFATDALLWSSTKARMHLLKEGSHHTRLKPTLGSLDRQAIASSLQAGPSLTQGKCLHALINKSGLHQDKFLGNLLISMYGRHGALQDARSVFDNMQQPNVISWTAMIAAYAQHEHEEEALQLFQEMQEIGIKPDKITYVSALRACAGVAALSQGQIIHARIVGSLLESDVIVGTALVNMYCKCAALKEARLVFDKMHRSDVVSWNAMIAGYSQNGHNTEALKVFRQMQHEGVKPNTITFISILAACANQADIGVGLMIHATIIDSNLESQLMVGNALVNMYGKCGDLEKVSSVFGNMRQRNVASWNTIINAYSQHGYIDKAFWLFSEMQQEGVRPNEVTLATLLNVCASMGAFSETKLIHACISKYGWQSDVVIGNALVYAYGKCGAPQNALVVFKTMHQRDTLSWNSMIAACAQNGHTEEAFQLFKEMLQENVNPDRVTFISLLSACSHAGKVEEGLHCFCSMIRDHAIIPTVEHYGCMIDLFGRAGQLKEAEDFICRMQIQPDALVWITLLDACRVHGDLNRMHAAEKILNVR